MVFYVYLIKTLNSHYDKSYVGYTNNLDRRISKHNANKGAKSTKGYKWILIYKKLFNTKSKALKFEYELKKNRKKRLTILQDYYEQTS